MTKLTLEQEFNLRSFESQVDKMSREQAQEFLVKLYAQMMLREVMFRDLLAHEWCIDTMGQYSGPVNDDGGYLDE